MQWKVPADLNTLMQRFSRGVRNPSLISIAILIAESWYFYDEHQKAVRKRAGCKRKAPGQLPEFKKQHVGPVQYFVWPAQQDEDVNSKEDEDEDENVEMGPSEDNPVSTGTGVEINERSVCGWYPLII